MVTPRSAFNGPLLLLLLLPAFAHGAATKPSLHQVEYIGIGYNILIGNPEGDLLQNGGVDPGLKPLRQVFALTYDDGKLTNDNEYRVPDEVDYVSRNSRVVLKEAFFGAESYAKKLRHHVSVDGCESVAFASVEFAASHRYEAVNEEATKNDQVFFSEESIENYGEIRYLLEKAEPSKMFLTDVCSLPASYDRATYMEFLDKWGTHIVKEVTLGVRSGKTYKESKSSFIKHASTDNSDSVSVGGSYKHFPASLSVDLDRFAKSSASQEKFGEEYTSYTIGSKEENEPISVKLMLLNESLDSQYWRKQSEYQGCGSFQRSTVQRNIGKAFGEYPAHKKLPPAKDPPVEIPLTWPEGRYALPAAIVNGSTTCPAADYMNWNLLDQNNTEDGHECSTGNHLIKDCERNKMRTYCVKTVLKAPETSWTWTPGVYCILKYGDKCPNGFNDGSKKFKAADKEKGIDSDSNTTPNGIKNSGSSQMDFCCREDGQTKKPIFLPRDSPFYLIKFHDGCQQVNGMTSSEKYTQWAVKQSTPTLCQGGKYPLPGNTIHDIKTTYCFYQPSSSTKREVKEARKLLYLPEESHSRQKKSLREVQQDPTRELSNESEESEKERQNRNAKRMELLLTLLAKHIDLRMIDEEEGSNEREGGNEERKRQDQEQTHIRKVDEADKYESEEKERESVKRMEELLNFLAKHIDITKVEEKEASDESKGGNEERKRKDHEQNNIGKVEEKEDSYESQDEDDQKVKRLEQLLNLLEYIRQIDEEEDLMEWERDNEEWEDDEWERAGSANNVFPPG